MTGSFSLPEINVFWLPDSNSVHKVYNSLFPFACDFSCYNFYYMLEKKNKTYTCMHCRKSLTAPSLRKKLNMITWDTGCSSLLLQEWLTQAILYIRKLMPSWPSNCVNHSLSQTGNNGPHYIASVSHFHQLPLEGATTFMLEKRDLGWRIKNWNCICASLLSSRALIIYLRWKESWTGAAVRSTSCKCVALNPNAPKLRWSSMF